jgi:tripartite-type tricarboxylate transporter receptor subunit TctC
LFWTKEIFVNGLLRYDLNREEFSDSKEGTRMRRRFVLLGILLAVIFSFTLNLESVWARYPEKKIRYIVPYAPGGFTDNSSRTLVRFMNPHLGNRIFGDNVAGAAGAIGMREAAKAAPDGYTLACYILTMMTGPLVVKDYPTWDTLDPICIVASDSSMIIVREESRFKTIKDLIDYAKAHPGEVTFGHSGVGSMSHIQNVAFAESAGLKFRWVPYKGANPAVVAAMGGHVDVAGATVSDVSSYVQAKQVRPLVIYKEKRFPFFPDVPTAREIGHDLVLGMWSGPSVPHGLPGDVRKILLDAARMATEDEGYKKAMDQMGFERVFWPNEEAIPKIKALNEFYKNMGAKMGLVPE